MNKHIESIKKKLTSSELEGSEVWVGWLWENTDPRFIIPKIKNYLKKETEGKVTILSLGEQVQIKDSSEEESTYFISSYKVENASSNIFMGDSDWKECGINPTWDNPGWSTSRDELIRMYKQ